MNGEKLLDLIENIDTDIIEESMDVRRRKILRPKKWYVIAIAAVLIMGFSVAATAKINPNFDAALIEEMGLNEGCQQLEDGTVQLSSSDSCEYKDQKYILSAGMSVGDSRTAYIKINTNIDVPESFDEKKDYYMIDDYGLEFKYPLHPNKRAGGYGSYFVQSIEEGKLSFILVIEDFEKLNSAQVKVHLKDLYLYHDLGEEDSAEKPELICHGEWNLKWTYSYTPHVKKYKVHKKITRDECDYTLKSVEISTLGLKVNGTTNIFKRGERDSINIEKIILKDGSEIDISQNSTGGVGTGIIPGTYHLEGYVMSYEIGQVLDEDNVSAIVVDGTTVEL